VEWHELIKKYRKEYDNIYENIIEKQLTIEEKKSAIKKLLD